MTISQIRIDTLEALETMDVPSERADRWEFIFGVICEVAGLQGSSMSGEEWKPYGDLAKELRDLPL